MLFLDANAFYSYIGRKNIGLIESTHVNEEKWGMIIYHPTEKVTSCKKNELQNHIADLERQIAEFPSGSVTKKKVSGRVYFYRRWTEDKKRKEKYIPVEEVETVRLQIEQRKRLEQELKELKKQLPKPRP